MIDAHRIRDLLPHRYPVLLVDRVLELEPGETIVATKAVTLNEPWYARLGPAPDPSDVDYPPVLLLESWAQTAGILANLSRPEEAGPGADVMLFGSASQVTFSGPVRPGDLLRHRVELARVLDGTVFVRGDSHVGDRLVLAVGQGVMAFRPADHMPTRPEPATTGRSRS